MKTDEQKNNDYKKNFPKWRKTFLELKEKDYKKALEWWKENLDIQADTYYNDEFTDRLPFIPSNEFHTSKKV